MDKSSINNIVKPKLKLKELPTCIQNEIIKMLFIGVLYFVFVIVYALVTFKLGMLLYLIPILLVYMGICLVWSYRFFYDKILVIDGTIIDIEEKDNDKKIKLKRALIKRVVRITYDIETNDGYEISVVRTSRKVVKKGTKIRLYTTPNNLIERTAQKPLINTVYYTEILELPKRKNKEGGKKQD